MCRRIIAGVLICALAGMNLPARAAKVPGVREIGVVTQAVNARVGTTVLSPGASLFEGDSVSTEAGGGLNVRSGKALLYVPGASGITLQRANELAQVKLNAGTVVFSAAQGSAVEIGVLGAKIRPVADVATNAQISIAGPKMIAIRAQRGDLLFTFNNESETIAEGSSVRVVLEPPKDANDSPVPQKKKSGKRPLGFYILIGGAVAIATLIVVIKATESPDRPN